MALFSGSHRYHSEQLNATFGTLTSSFHDKAVMGNLHGKVDCSEYTRHDRIRAQFWH